MKEEKDTTQELTSYKNKLKTLNQNYLKLQMNLASVEDKLTILEILKKAFSTNGLLAYKIESLVKELEML